MTTMLRNTVALVTGGASGLGAAAVRTLLHKGARVVVGDLSEASYQANIVEQLNTTLPERNHDENNNNIPDLESNLRFCPLDVTKPETIEKALDLVQETFGQPVNAVVNSAGIATASKTINKKGEASDKAMEEFSRTLQVNTIGSFHVARLAAERMVQGTTTPTDTNSSSSSDETDLLRGCIIQTASIAAFEGQVGQVAYSASKGAIVGMTLPMARDLAPWGIRVVSIVRSIFFRFCNGCSLGAFGVTLTLFTV